MRTKMWMRHTVWIALLCMGVFIAAEVEAQREGVAVVAVAVAVVAAVAAVAAGSPGVAQPVAVRSVLIVRPAREVLPAVVRPVVGVCRAALRRGSRAGKVPPVSCNLVNR